MMVVQADMIVLHNWYHSYQLDRKQEEGFIIAMLLW